VLLFFPCSCSAGDEVPAKYVKGVTVQNKRGMMDVDMK
jgi:hypothetical protein